MVKNIEQMKTFKTISNIVKENDLHRLEADCYGLLVFKTNNEFHPEMDGNKYQGHITRCGKIQGNFLGVRCHNTGTMIAPMQKVHFNFKVKDIKRFEIEI